MTTTLAAARPADWQMAEVALSTPTGPRRELAARPTSATLPSSGEAERYFRGEAHQARAAAVRQRRLEFDEQEKASAAARGRAGANKAPRAAPAAAPKPSARANPPPAASATSPPARARKPARAPERRAAPRPRPSKAAERSAEIRISSRLKSTSTPSARRLLDGVAALTTRLSQHGRVVAEN